MPKSHSRPPLAVVLFAVSGLPCAAAPALPHGANVGSLAEPAKLQCYTKEVCVRRARPSGHRPPCIEWATKKFCEPHVYNNPKKPPDAPPDVRVPKLIAKPKPWQFQRQPDLGRLPSIGRSPSMMRR